MKSMCDRASVLVTGATGAVGARVVQALYDLGYRVRTLSIDPPRPGMLPNDIEVLIGDVSDPSSVKPAMQAVEAVIHLAALLHVVNPSPTFHEKYERINVGGTGIVVEAAIRAGVKRIVFFSTIAVYGDSAGLVLNEDTPPRPSTFYAQTKLKGEQIVLGAKGLDGKLLGTVLRFGAIYGSRIKGNYQQLLRTLARGRFIRVGDGRNRRTLIYDKDVGNAVVLALQNPAAAGRIFNVSDGQFHTMNEIISAMCHALGRNPPRFSLPVGPARFAAGIFEDAGRLIGFRSPIVRATIDKYTEDIAVDSSRIQTELGFKPEFDLKLGWRETVQEMRKMGQL